MSHALAIRLLTVAAVVLLLSSLVGGPYADALFAVVAVAFPALLMFLGTSVRGERGRSQAWVILGLVVLLESCVFGMLALRGTVTSGGWVLGLPTVTALQIYGMCLLPLALVALGFAVTFADFRVEKTDLERLRRTSHSDSDA